MLEVTIDKNAGYCFGVEFAIQMAEDEMQESETLYCLGDIVHNDMEVKRLYDKGLRIIDKEQFKELKNAKVLIRAHGEPPETYKIALENNIELIDASCPVVLKLQNRIKHSYDRMDEEGQIIIYGKKGHAEVIGLNGQIKESGIIVSSIEELNDIDFSKPTTLYSQTTKSTAGFYALKEEIEKRMQEAQKTESPTFFDANDSICRQVSNRVPQITKFAQVNDVLLFVSGKKSSNGKALYESGKLVNPNSYFIESEEEIELNWFNGVSKVGISGATSTPMWLMERVADFVRKI